MSDSIFGRSSRSSFSSTVDYPAAPPPSPPPPPSPASPPGRPRFSNPSTAARIAPAAPRAPKASWSVSSDVALLAVLDAPLQHYETAAVGFARKEAELRHVMETLTVLEARALQSRLSNPKPGDQLAASFMRMTADRRARLINFLSDARRREAVGRRSV